MTETVNSIISYDTEDDVFIWDAKFYLVNGYWRADRDGGNICGCLNEEDAKLIEEFLAKRRAVNGGRNDG